MIGTNVGTVADLDGNFELELPAEVTELRVSYTGYDNKRVPITGDTLTIVLEEGMALEEVVVTGYAARNTLAGVVAGVSNRVIRPFRRRQEAAPLPIPT